MGIWWDVRESSELLNGRTSVLVDVSENLECSAAYGLRILAVAKLSPISNYRGECMHRNHKTKGVTVVEYAIMLALIAIAVAVAAPNLTSAVVGVFSKASSVMNK
jgi:Flp pilus assembly pilin Flp